MANVAINSTTFNPFTFDEMLKPLAMYAQEYRAQEAALAEIADKTGIWASYANEADQPLYDRYNNFNNDLNEVAGQLSSQGLDIAGRKRMNDIKRRYNSEIVPIETAFKRREALIDKQRTAMDANPTLRFERDAKNLKLSELIDDPTLDYGRNYSGALLAQQVSGIVKNLKNTFVTKGQLEGIGLPFKYTQGLRAGASPEEVDAVVTRAIKDGDPTMMHYLSRALNIVIDSSGIRDWAEGTQAFDDLVGFAKQGLYDAIGSTTYKDYTDDASLKAYEVSLKPSTGTKKGKEDDEEGLFPLNPRQRFSTNTKFNADRTAITPSRAHVTKEGNGVGQRALNNMAKEASQMAFVLSDDSDKGKYEGLDKTYSHAHAKAFFTKLAEGKATDSDIREFYGSNMREETKLLVSMIRNNGYENTMNWVAENIAGNKLRNSPATHVAKAQKEAYDMIYAPLDTQDLADPRRITSSDAIGNTEWNIALNSTTGKELKTKVGYDFKNRKEISFGSDGSITPVAVKFDYDEFDEHNEQLGELNAYRDPNSDKVYIYSSALDKDGNTHNIIMDNIHPIREKQIQTTLNNAYIISQEYEKFISKGDLVSAGACENMYKDYMNKVSEYLIDLAGVVKSKEYQVDYEDR